MKIDNSLKSLKESVNKVFGNKVRVRVCGICIEDNKLLMVKHLGIGKNKYLWAPPGGGLEFGEQAADTLKREFLEETNLTVEAGRFMFVNEYVEPPLHAIELFFEVKRLSGVLQTGTDPEIRGKQIIADVRFMSFEEARQEHPQRLHNLFNYAQSVDELQQLRGHFVAPGKLAYR